MFEVHLFEEILYVTIERQRQGVNKIQRHEVMVDLKNIELQTSNSFIIIGQS